MSDFDEKLRDALEDDPRELDEMVARSQPGLIQLVVGALRGQSIALNLMGIVPSLGFTVIAVLSVFWFFDAQEVRDQIMYATIFMTCNAIVLAMKIWFWMVMNRNATSREIKRLEMQIAKMASRMPG